MKLMLMFCLAIFLFPVLGSAQDTFHIFPTFVDGSAADGTFYRSTLMVIPWFEDDSASCALRTIGLSAQFEDGPFTSFLTFSISAGNSIALRTGGSQGLATGYATLTCTEFVYATVLYSFYAPNGLKFSEATVFSTEREWSDYRLIVDQRDGAQLGLAIANNTDVAHTYDIILTANGLTRTGSITVPGRTSLSRFLNQLVSAPANAVGLVSIRARDFSDFSAIGLRFTGQGFTTIPAYP